MNKDSFSYTLQRPEESWGLQLPFFYATLQEPKTNVHDKSQGHDDGEARKQQESKEDYLKALLSSLRL